MRKLILAATSVAVLAAPAVSMAAHSTVQTSRVNSPYSVSYTDTYGAADQGMQLTCNGVHEVKIGKTAANSFDIDKFHCKVSLVGTTPKGNRVAPFTPNQQLTMSSFGSGWNSDYNGVAATGLTGQANAKGNAFSAVATYPFCS
jgi:hypothetical protein